MGPRSVVKGGWNCQIGRRGRMRADPLGASVGLHMGPGNAVLGGWHCQVGCGGRMWAVPLGAL
eukprot:4892618-Pyramimonas_sp.AAC.1